MNDHDLLIRIDENVEALKRHAEKHQEQDDTIHGKQDARLTALEAAGQSQKGAVAAVTAVISALWAVGTTIFMALHK